ncbi:MAG TPA: RNA polymerase subunit sigma-70 [Pseudolabrys sp.]|nr:RNA polymerase subunit sigma-70 [Pseudolabrys sp.]
MPGVRRELNAALGRDPTRAELAQRLNVTEGDLIEIEKAEKQPYANGGVRIYDVSDPTKPKFIHHHLTGGIGVHRFDMDERYAYLSTEMDGFVGNILVTYDLSDPKKPQEVSRWWMPGQNIAAGETPTWSGKRHRLHHALRFGNEMWASCWHGGFRVVDIADITKPKTVASYNYHPPFPEPTHTAMPVPIKIGDKRIALTIDEEDQAQSANEEEARRGRLHAGIMVFDVSDLTNVKPLSLFEVSELDSPFARTPGARFGAHQFHERMTGTLVHAVWFSAGLRIVDVADPSSPREVGYFIPDPVDGRPAPQSNDVVLDDRGLIYVVDRMAGFDVLEFNGKS